MYVISLAPRGWTYRYSSSSPASLVVFDTRLDHLKLPVIRTLSRSTFDEHDGPEDEPRPESVLFFAEKYFELSGTFQCQWESWIRSINSWLSPTLQCKDNPSRMRKYLFLHCIVSGKTWLRTSFKKPLMLLTNVCIHLVSIQIACFKSLLINMSSESDVGVSGFFSFVLKPGSSLHPSFLLAVDCAFAILFLVFAWLAYLTNGNLHFFFLMGIEIALWASIKW